MQDFDFPEEVNLLTAAVWRMAGAEGIEALTALAWLIRNRQKQAQRHRKRYLRAHPDYGDGSLRMAICSALNEEGIETDVEPCRPPGEAYSKALAAVWLVWSGESPDPTTGATRCHHHGMAPFWSRDRAPSALIGDRFYFTEAGNPTLSE